MSHVLSILNVNNKNIISLISNILYFIRALGHLQYIRIWHNNRAYDDFASWFLSKIIIKDVQTGEKYEFICNQWLAVEHGDGEVNIFSKFQTNFYSCKTNVCKLKTKFVNIVFVYVGRTGPKMRWDRRQGQFCVSIPTCWYETPQGKPSLVLNFYESPPIKIYPSSENILCFRVAVFSNACQCNVVRATG